MPQEKKASNRKSVASLQPFSPEALPKAIAVTLTEYISKTELPILSEFCVEYDLYEELIIAMCPESKEIYHAIKILENKKRAALERKIYTSELNATIGAHLMKNWAEIVVPEKQKYRVALLIELDELELTSEEIKIYSDINRRLDFLNK